MSTVDEREIAHQGMPYLNDNCCMPFRYPNYECGAFVSLHLVGTAIRVGSFSPKHRHDLYVINRRLTSEEEQNVYDVMDIIHNTVELSD